MKKYIMEWISSTSAMPEGEYVKYEDALREISQRNEEIQKLMVVVDKLLNHCDKEAGECSECSKIVCPHGCDLHFHHDGCPACYMNEEEKPL